jgi:hypothetical protein
VRGSLPGDEGSADTAAEMPLLTCGQSRNKGKKYIERYCFIEVEIFGRESNCPCVLPTLSESQDPGLKTTFLASIRSNISKPLGASLNGNTWLTKSSNKSRCLVKVSRASGKTVRTGARPKFTL